MDKEEVSKDAGEVPDESKEASSASSPAQEFYEEATSKLKEMGYHIFKDEEDGMTKFRQTDENKKFKFINQKHYDLLGDILGDWIQGYMMTHQKMNKVMIPFDSELKEDCAQAPIFISDDWETNTERALVLIQGTGDVRSGYWARSVGMNDNLDLGSMIPDIDFAQENGFSVLVMNPNYSYTPDKVRVDPKIRGMNYHSNYCWAKFVEKGVCPAKEIFIVAHSAGGGGAHEIIVNNESTMIERVRGIALTDACHGRFYTDLDDEGKEWAKESGVAYDASKEPLDTPLTNRYFKSIFPEVSAGHNKHVYTTGCARESYLKWFYNRSKTLAE